MPSDLRRQLQDQLFKARDEYMAAIQAYYDALAAALKTEALDFNAEYERTTAELERKHQAYQQATDDIRAVNSREAQ